MNTNLSKNICSRVALTYSQIGRGLPDSKFLFLAWPRKRNQKEGQPLCLLPCLRLGVGMAKKLANFVSSNSFCHGATLPTPSPLPAATQRALSHITSETMLKNWGQHHSFLSGNPRPVSFKFFLKTKWGQTQRFLRGYATQKLNLTPFCFCAILSVPHLFTQ